MFYNMINKKRDAWYQSPDCTVKEIVDYVEKTNQMRDAQIEAIKTYLFLKIGCGNNTLYSLFTSGAFNSLDVDKLEISAITREYFITHPAALALYEYVTLKNDEGEQVSEKVAKAIQRHPTEIDYSTIFKNMFYGVSYSDYLFSLPMGAGKTYLMAAFIYLDLYFAQNEPDNKDFAHNFIIFAPSGLKSSVVPSLRTIQNYNPSWVIPEPSATEIKRLIKFEVLDQSKTANKSNKTKNPNVQKIALHQPLDELIGLVAVVNAEKVILDRVEIKNGQLVFSEESDDAKDRQANELRNLIGKLPSLSIFIDEVHHAVSDDIKLRGVVNKWAENRTINSVIGFSGTPYLETSEKIEIQTGLSISSIEIMNIVYYYPLINGVGNFLKRPVVKVFNNSNSLDIVEAGVRLFLDEYKDKKYHGEFYAKLGIYCGTIEKLEEQIYPLVARIISEYGSNPTDSVLKFHRGNKKYPMPPDSQLEFDTLDKAISKIRIVLLVQIGKEGWDCRSLTGIILSQEGDCPKNMVLQTSCRCLRQVVKGVTETAVIYLNSFNAEKLNDQLRQQHHISIKELENADNQPSVEIKRYDRTVYLKLPKVDYYQLKINFNTLVIDNSLNTENDIENAVSDKVTVTESIATQDFSEIVSDIDTTFIEKGTNVANFNAWLYNIAKESFCFVTVPMLEQHESILMKLFEQITYKKGNCLCFSSKYRISLINENIRKAFYEKRTFESIEELIPNEASLLKVENFKTDFSTIKSAAYYPDSQTVENIILDDKGKFKANPQLAAYVEAAKQVGDIETVTKWEGKLQSHPMKDKSFHYIPYKTDSGFEQLFLENVLKLTCFKEKELEVYYNGDRELTEFKIKCFKGGKGKWHYIGMYTPDFLLLQRKDGKIYKAIIVETKGQIYANEPVFLDKRAFVENEFLRNNNDQYGYKKFDYLYLEDTMTENERLSETIQAIDCFFGGIE